MIAVGDVVRNPERWRAVIPGMRLTAVGCGVSGFHHETHIRYFRYDCFWAGVVRHHDAADFEWGF